MTYKKRIVRVFPPQSQNCSSAITLLAVFFEFTPCFQFSGWIVCMSVCVAQDSQNCFGVLLIKWNSTYRSRCCAALLSRYFSCLFWSSTSSCCFRYMVSRSLSCSGKCPACHIRAWAATIEVWTFHPPNPRLKESCSSVGIIKTHG